MLDATCTQMSVLGDDLASLQLTEKWLVSVGKQLIRSRVIQSRSPAAAKRRPKAEGDTEEESSKAPKQKRVRTSNSGQVTMQAQAI